MNPDTGRFENLKTMEKDVREKRMVELRAAVIRVNPQYEVGKRQDPCLSVGEIVEIKGVRFRVTRIKADGKLGLQMLRAVDILPALKDGDSFCKGLMSQADMENI